MERIRKAIEEDRFEEFRRDFFNNYDMSRNFSAAVLRIQAENCRSQYGINCPALAVFSVNIYNSEDAILQILKGCVFSHE